MAHNPLGGVPLAPTELARQAGALYQVNGSWVGSFRDYRRGKCKRVTVRLGKVDQVAKDQARTKLTELIASTVKIRRAADAVGDQVIHAEFMKHLEASSSHKTGAISELLVCADLLSKSWDVFRAVDPASSCDLMAIRGADILRVEVKTNCPILDLTNKFGKFDLLAVVSRSGAITYRPLAELGDLSRVVIEVAA